MSAAGRMLGRRHAGGGWARGVRSLLAALLLVVGAQRASAQTEVVEYYGQDALGSIRIVFDASGAAIARADYEPFGELFTVPSMPGTSELPAKQFTGQERDAEASLDYFGARFLVPRTGRFSQVDPVYAGLFEPQKWNRYQYARNNPLTFVDPTGLDDEPPPEDPNAPGGYSCAAILALNAHDPYCWRPSPWDWADPSTYLPGAWNWIGSTLESVMPEITPGDTVVAQLFGVQLIGGAVVAAGVVAAPGVATATTSVVLTKAPAATTVVVAAGGGGVVATQVANEIKLIGGYYQASGSVFRFPMTYYDKLWRTGRGAPFLQAQEVLETYTLRVPDNLAGFYRYSNGFIEMVYNPTTQVVWHLQPKK